MENIGWWFKGMNKCPDTLKYLNTFRAKMVSKIIIPRYLSQEIKLSFSWLTFNRHKPQKSVFYCVLKRTTLTDRDFCSQLKCKKECVKTNYSINPWPQSVSLPWKWSLLPAARNKIEPLAWHDVFSIEFVVQFFWERLRTKLFWWSQRTGRSCAMWWQFGASCYRRGSRLKQHKNGSRSRTNIPIIPNHKHWNPSDDTTNLTVSHVCRVGVRQLLLTLAFISCRYGLSLLLLCSQICCSILNCS